MKFESKLEMWIFFVSLILIGVSIYRKYGLGLGSGLLLLWISRPRRR